MRHPKRSPKGTVSSHFVYILNCSDGRFYTGYTTDPLRRLREHNRGVASRFTRGRLPVRLVFLERAGSRTAGLRREYEIKNFSRKRKILLCRRFSERAAPSSR